MLKEIVLSYVHNNLKGTRILLDCFIENKRQRTLTIKLLRNMQRKMTNFCRSAFNDLYWRTKTIRPFKQESIITYCWLWFLSSKPNCFQNCISVIKQQNQNITKSNQNVTITVSTIIIPSLLGLMTDSHSSLKLNIRVLWSSELPPAQGNSSNAEQIPNINLKFL